MKYLTLTLSLMAAVALAAGVVAFRATGDAAVQQALARQDPMEWLRADFQLSEAQFAAIKQLHDSYSVVCEAHCRDIQNATRARNALKATPGVDPAALLAAEQQLESVRVICETAITTHVRQCAAEMPPEAGERYLALVLPKIRDFDHEAPPDLQLNRHRH